ncbi:MAG: hypothetical protein V4596_10805 [Bdellovibrionota bacterium]
MKHIIIGITLLASQTSLATDGVFSKLNLNEPACYGREYGADYLKSHDKQTVQKIQSKFVRSKRTDSKYETRIMEVEVTLKGKKHEFKNYRGFFLCNEEDNYCGIECDGGRVQVSLNKSGNLILENKGFVIEGGCGNEEKTLFLEALAGGDDKFEMVPLPKAFCQRTSELN